MASFLEDVKRCPGRLGGSANSHLFAVLVLVDRTAEDAGVAEVDFEFRRAGQRALDDRFRQRIFDVLLQRAAQRTGAVGAVARSSPERSVLPRPSAGS